MLISLEKLIQEFLKLLEQSENIVFFGGAGVSTESGIPDFRSVDGLYQQTYQYPPETILSHTFFMQNTQEFYRFYREKMLLLDVEPNITHKKLAQLEERSKLKCIITQNIDGLHQKACSKHVLELHGSIHRNYCISCGRFYTIEKILESKDIPRCECGGIIRPDVVLYEEGLDREVLDEAVKYLEHADLLIIGGTSLAVYPAAGLIRYFNGKAIVLINKSETSFDDQADIFIKAGLGEVFARIPLA